MQGTFKDLTGMRFGLLTVMGAADPKGRRTMWNVKCACSTEKQVRGENLVDGRTKSCGCARQRFKSTKMEKRYSLVNQRFGRLLVLWRAPKGNRKSRNIVWECKCDCGKLTTVSASALKSGATQSCGCLQLDTACLPPGQCGFHSLLEKYKRSASKRGLEWALTDEDFRRLVVSSCHYCGETPKQVSVPQSENGKFSYNGIDRLNNNMGYVLGNVVSCCGVHNRMKGTMSYQQFIASCESVVLYKNRLRMGAKV
jgi:hypothetical protein